MELLWHYTTLDIFKRILKQGAILPDRTEPNNENEIATVTFSSNQEWEGTRYRVGRLPDGRLVMMNRTLLQHFCGLVRIGVQPEVAPMDWHMMKDKAGLSKQAQKAIYDFAIGVGARTSHWHGTFSPVTEDQWVIVQNFNDNDGWVDMIRNQYPNVDDVELTQDQGYLNGLVDIKLDKQPQVDVPLGYEVVDDLSLETAPVNGETHRESTV